jgi:hypothetical protein
MSIHKILLNCLILSLFVSVSRAQKQKSVSQFIDLSGTIGQDQGTGALSYVYNWKTGKRKKFELGAGLRWTTYAGTKKEFYTAGPASLTRTSSVPFLIVFAGINEENIDTLVVQRPLIHALNLSFNMGYQFTKRIYGGINIDVVGFSFGRKSSSVLTSDGETMTDPEASPTAFNILLTGDHDSGSLNSEFFVRYQAGKRWSFKALYQFLFAEYTTHNIVQTAPDGTEIDQFRNKANNIGLGIVYHLQ